MHIQYNTWYYKYWQLRALSAVTSQNKNGIYSEGTLVLAEVVSHFALQEGADTAIKW